MALALADLTCNVISGDWCAGLSAARTGPLPALRVAMEDGRVVWRFEGMTEAQPPARHEKSLLAFRVAKSTLLDQRGLLPAASVAPTMRFGLERPMTGEERWGGRSRPVAEPVGEFPVLRTFVALPDPAGFVADAGRESLRVEWTSGPLPDGGGREEPHLAFEIRPAFDAAPDRRWPEPVLELEMAPAAYANILAALVAVR